VTARWSGELNGAWSMLGSPHLLPPIAAAGFDWLCLDAQHGRFDDASIIAGLAELGAAQIRTVVRVRSLDAGLIGRALDAGADGVIVPMVANAEQAAEAVRATFYPPLGERSWGPIASYESSGETPEVMCAVMIETAPGLANATEIAATPGLGMIFVGPIDLSLALGLELDQLLEDFGKSSPLATIVASCERAGIVAGAFAGTPERAVLLRRHGFTVVATVTDALIATRGGRLLLSQP
jgi:4-hydroxy-2-oxoheptanedioate aldolase